MFKAVSLFAGVGGIDIAFAKAGVKTIWANELDKNAVTTFSLNNKTYMVNKDIRDVEVNNVPNHDILLAGFPCQAFSIAGHRKGFNDERGNMFLEVMKIVEAKKPEVIFLENVKNLATHDSGKTFKIIIKSLEQNNYHVKYKVMNSSEYGNIPQNRERIYIVGFKNKDSFTRFKFPGRINLDRKIKDIVDFNTKVDDYYYYNKNNCYFIDELEKEIPEDNNDVYQWRRRYIRKNKSSLFPTLTANMGTGGHNIPIIYTKDGFRKITPQECFKIQGYPSEFKIPDNVSRGQLYKQAGNSVVVPVVERIAKNIIEALI